MLQITKKTKEIKSEVQGFFSLIPYSDLEQLWLAGVVWWFPQQAQDWQPVALHGESVFNRSRSWQEVRLRNAWFCFVLLLSSLQLIPPFTNRGNSTSLLYMVGREEAGAAVRNPPTRVEGEAGWRTAAGKAAQQLKPQRKASAALVRRPSGR